MNRDRKDIRPDSPVAAVGDTASAGRESLSRRTSVSGGTSMPSAASPAHGDTTVQPAAAEHRGAPIPSAVSPARLPRGFGRGLYDALPIIFGYFSASVAFGLLARNSSLGLWETQSFSLFTYTGAAQFMALNLLNAGAAGPQIVISYGLLNLRYLLMSAAVARKIDFRRFFQRPLLAFGVTDENFAVTTGHAGSVSPSYQAGVELGPWTAWNTGTLAGWLFGGVLPATLSAAMVSSLYALFLALLLPDLRKGLPWILTATVAAGANSVLEVFGILGPGWSFVAAMIAGTAVGMILIPQEKA